LRGVARQTGRIGMLAPKVISMLLRDLAPCRLQPGSLARTTRSYQSGR
jgi:hypothetical protein